MPLPTPAFHVEIDGEPVPVLVRRDSRARRLILRLHEPTQGVMVTLTTRTPLKEARRFVEAQIPWIRAHRAHVPSPVLFANGVIIPYRGQAHKIVHTTGQGVVRVEAGQLLVQGRIEHLPRRLAVWLKQDARRHIEPALHAYAAQIGKRAGKLTIRDTRSRWASCSADGRMNFSWRLILTPPHVLDYVVAHEVAHLVEMNHGPAFHALVREIYGSPAQAQRWLKRHGRDLHRYGY